jgi:hypothetical protein
MPKPTSATMPGLFYARSKGDRMSYDVLSGLLDVARELLVGVLLHLILQRLDRKSPPRG